MAVLTPAQVKNYLRYDSSDTSNDTALGYIIDAAQRWIENHTGQMLVQREVTENPKAFPVARISGEAPYFDLRWRPYVADSLSISYLDADLALNEDFTAFTVFGYRGTTRVIPDVAWPGTFVGISFTYTAGYADADAVPEDLLHAICIYAAMSDEDRGETSSMGWTALQNILEHYRLPVLA